MDEIERIEKALYSMVPDNGGFEIDSILKSMSYSLSAGGKRIRPRLTLNFAKLCKGSEEAAMPYACALEMVHTFSLIHDDLPCMDNDDLRRGKPSNHKVFGENVALLAGDSLLILAFEIMSRPENVARVGADSAVRCIRVLSERSGSLGMCGGQVMDIAYEDKRADLKTLEDIQKLKTGALISAACEIGCLTAGASDEEVRAAYVYGDRLGRAFQIVDDILDVVSTTEELGKPVGSDEKNNKSTFVTLLGLEKCRALADELTDEAISALDIFEGDKDELIKLALSLKTRRN